MGVVEFPFDDPEAMKKVKKSFEAHFESEDFKELIGIKNNEQTTKEKNINESAQKFSFTIEKRKNVRSKPNDQNVEKNA